MKRDRPIFVNRNRRYRVSRDPLYGMRVRDLPEDEVVRIISEGIERHNRAVALLLFGSPTAKARRDDGTFGYRWEPI